MSWVDQLVTFDICKNAAIASSSRIDEFIVDTGYVGRACIASNICSSLSKYFLLRLYMFASEGLYMNEAYATALTLIVIVIAINALVFAIKPDKEKKSESKKQSR